MSRRSLNLTLAAAVLLATFLAALLAYGTDPYWGQFRHGLGLILFTHRLQWVLATASLLLCVAVVGMIVAGRRRAWWLIALGPVLALFVHRFIANPMRQFAIVENPTCVAADAAGFLGDNDYVVGVQFGDAVYAYPYAVLFNTPVVLQANHEQRYMLIWSALANRAVAFKIDREIKLAELQVVSTPANAILLYNGRVGQFINGLTGETTKHERPIGVHAGVETQKLTWEKWKGLHSGTLVLAPREGQNGPSTPVLPKFPLPPPTRLIEASSTARPVETPIIFVPTTRPLAVPLDAIGSEPANISAGQTHLLLLRDPQTGLLKAFDRRVQEDLFPMFRRKSDPKRPAVALEDQDSGTEWSADGKAIEGPFKGEQLRPVAVEEMLYWGVMECWYPDLQWVTPTPTSGPVGNFSNPGDGRRRGRPRG